MAVSGRQTDGVCVRDELKSFRLLYFEIGVRVSVIDGTGFLKELIYKCWT